MSDNNDTPDISDDDDEVFAPIEIPVGGISPIEINEEMERSFLDYAMSVIVSRALPDARDGLNRRQVCGNIHRLASICFDQGQRFCWRGATRDGNISACF